MEKWGFSTGLINQMRHKIAEIEHKMRFPASNPEVEESEKFRNDISKKMALALEVEMVQSCKDLSTITENAA